MTYEVCERCGMGWMSPNLDGLEPAPHVCPEPLAPESARRLRDALVASGIPVSPRLKARIRPGQRDLEGES